MKEKIITNFVKPLRIEKTSDNTIEKNNRDVITFLDFSEACLVAKKLVMEYKSQFAEKYAVCNLNSTFASINSLLFFR